MIHLLIYVNVTFTSHRVFCKGFVWWTFRAGNRVSDCSALPCVQSRWRGEGPLQGRPRENVLSHEKSVLRLLWMFSCWKLSVGGGGVASRVSLPCSPLCWVAAVAPGRQAWKRREGSAVCGAMLAQHFAGSRAPSAQAENFAPANCDFRTQVCSWTWTPSCQCVAICHQHMAP